MFLQEAKALELYNKALGYQHSEDYTKAEETYNLLLSSDFIRDVSIYWLYMLVFFGERRPGQRGILLGECGTSTLFIEGERRAILFCLWEWIKG